MYEIPTAVLDPIPDSADSELLDLKFYVRYMYIDELMCMGIWHSNLRVEGGNARSTTDMYT